MVLSLKFQVAEKWNAAYIQPVHLNHDKVYECKNFISTHYGSGDSRYHGA